MPYIIETWDKENHQARRQLLRAEHIDYLDQNIMLLLACGAKLDEQGNDLGGGIYIIDVKTHEAAQQFIEQDPFFKGKLFEKVQITQWRKTYFNQQFCL